MSEPTTEAGKRLIGHWASHSGPVIPPIDRVQALVAAIEAEARAAVLRELRAEVEHLDTARIFDEVGSPARVRLEAVLAAIDRRLEP